MNEGNIQTSCTVIDSCAELAQMFPQRTGICTWLGQDYFMITLSHYHLVVNFLVCWKRHWRVAVFTWTVKSWTMFKTGSNLSHRTAMSRVSITWWNSGASAWVVLEIIFEINYLISFMWLLFCFHLIQPNDLHMKIFIYKNSKSDKYITEANH